MLAISSYTYFHTCWPPAVQKRAVHHSIRHHTIPPSAVYKCLDHMGTSQEIGVLIGIVPFAAGSLKKGKAEAETTQYS